MAIVKWRPFSDQIFRSPGWEDFFEELDMRSTGTAVDMYETDDSVVVEMPMPGVQADDVDISVTGDTLTVRAESKEEKKKEDKKRKYYMQEMHQMRYARSVQLPASVNTAKTQAEMNDGILKVTLPKTEEAKPKTIKVKTKSG